MNNLLADNLLKKSTSLANLGPFMFNPNHFKTIGHHKSIVESKG
jgi:hypothetical protein